jgi:pimeloyl-ACP methyl ester carboxylesterase
MSLLHDAPKGEDHQSGFLELRHGRVYYEIAGPEEGRPVLLIHGIASGCFVWDRNFGPLANSGLRVYRFDLYGRGQSAKPNLDYNLELYCEQVVALCNALGLSQAIDVVGLSMGGAVAVGFADRYPARVAKLALIAPAGVPSRIPLLVRLVCRKGLGEIVYDLVGARVLLLGARRSLRRPNDFTSFFEKIESQFSKEGYFPAVLSSIRNMPLYGMADAYQRVGRHNRETCLIWGDRDQIVPFSGHEQICKWIPDIRFDSLSGSGHACNLEDAEKVNYLLTSFLTSPSSSD